MFSSFFLLGVYLLKYAAFLISYVSNSDAFPKPLTTAEEERYVRLAAEGDEEAKNVLIERNLRLVAHVAKKYTPASGYDQDDLISTGTIGLIKAIKSFDSTKQTRLATYASRCIENEILMLMRSGKKQQQDVSLNDCLGHDSDGNEVTFIDVLSAEDDDIVDTVNVNINKDKLYKFIGAALNEREKQIICMRYGLSCRPYTQREIASLLNISRSYVSRIEKKALERLLECYEQTGGSGG